MNSQARRTLYSDFGVLYLCGFIIDPSKDRGSPVLLASVRIGVIFRIWFN
jgi:hypothetical protein